MTYLETNLTDQSALRALFDEEYYLSQFPDRAAVGADALAHYMTIGWVEGRKPSPLLDVEKYLSQYPDVVSALSLPQFAGLGRPGSRRRWCRSEPTDTRTDCWRRIRACAEVGLCSQRGSVVARCGSTTTDVSLIASLTANPGREAYSATSRASESRRT